MIRLVASTLAAASLATSTLAAPPVAPSQSAHAAAPVFDAMARRDIVAKLVEALRERYVFPDVGERAATKIGTSLAAGDYDMLIDPAAFTARLSTDMAAIAHDKHLKAWSSIAPPPPLPMEPIEHGEAGVTRADKLAGGIGYIEVFGFLPPAMFNPVLNRAMTSLKGSRALIIDDRRNGGGDPESVAYLVSFLVKPGQPINDIVSRTEKTTNFTRQSYRAVPTPVNFADVPIIVLTSHNSFSGGEEFPYDVQALKRGTIIGAVTGGGANPVSMIDLGHDAAATIPFGRAENPVTKTNWEGRGVQPDVVVPAGDALKVALQRLGQTPVAGIAEASVQQVFAPRTTPLAGSDTVLRRVIAQYVSGKMDYAAMPPAFADRVQQELPHLQAMLTPLGPVQSLKFQQVDMLGGDQYEVTFAKGSRIIAIVLGSRGEFLGTSDPQIPPPTK